MYQTTVKGEGLFQALSQGYGEPVRTFGVTEKGETPVSLVNIGLAACITMCVQGYYASQEGNKTMPVQVESR
ncbi:TPA: OsmC family peroxiredoxin, partial [Streptococcus suis]